MLTFFVITFFACLLFNSFYALVYIPYFGGEFVYYDSNGIKRLNSFWFLSTSPLAQSAIGSIVTIVFFFIKDILTLITTLILNIVSLFEMKKYFKTRSLLIGRRNAIGPNESTNDSTRITNAPNEAQNSKKRNQIKLMLIMCSISIVERISIVLVNVYCIFSVDYVALLLGTFQDLILVLGPCISFFVFFHFNRDFKREFLIVVNKFISKIKAIPTATDSLNDS
jgi:hypothetical protein